MSQMPATAPAAQAAPAPAAPMPSTPAPAASAPASSSVNIPKAFAKAPVRPPAPGSSAVKPTPTPAPVGLPPQQPQLQPQQAQPAPMPPAQQQPQAQQAQTAPTPPAQPQPQSQPQQASQQPDPYLMQIQQMQHAWDTERQAYQQREAQYQQALNQLVQQRQEMSQQLQNQSFENLFTEEELAQFESIDPNEAKLLGKKMMQSMMGPLQQMGAQSQQQVEYLNGVIRQQAEEIQGLRKQSLTNDILRAHPDFFQMQADPGFRAYMGERNGLSAKTRDQAAAEEFLAGNTAYIIDMLNQYKGMQPAQQQAMAVPPVQSPTPNGPMPAQPAQPQHTLTELNRMMRLHHITPEQYTAELNKLRQASAPPIAVNNY